MKIFIETTQGQASRLELQKRPLKIKTLEIYSKKSHIDCYYFYQQYKNHFETSGTIEMNRTLFTALYLCGTISLR